VYKFSRFSINKLLLLMLLLIVLSPVSTLQAGDTSEEIPESYEMVAQNEQFQLYVDSEALTFKLLDKRSGYLWHSGLDEPIEGDRLNTSWRAFARGGLSIEYFDRRGSNTRVSIDNSTHTLNVTQIEQGISAILTFDDFGITVEMRLLLEEEGIRVEIPADSIREDNEEFRLSRVYVFPFLGATRGGTVPGYMFLPDGVGSLVHYADTTPARNMFYGRYYGADLGMIGRRLYSDEIVAPIPISYPVFGAVHGEGENAFISVVENGASYGEVQMHPSGIITNFNFIYNAFIYNQTYFQATNRSGDGVTTIQRQTNHFDAVVHYRFLTGDEADYVGMAHSYRQYLLDNNLLRHNEFTNSDIGIRLEFLGGDKEKVMAWHEFISMTTVEQVNEVLDGLQLPNTEVIYYGWQPLGASSMHPLSFRIENNLGSLDDIRNLADRVHADGGNFSLYYNPQAAIFAESGYSSRSDLAMAITNTAIGEFQRDAFEFFTINALENRHTRFTNNLQGQLDTGLALDSIGWTLYSDFRDSSRMNRQESLIAYQELLSETDFRLTFYRPNDYFYGIAESYYDMPLSDNGYIFSTETVPFLPIVLSGHIPYYGSALNFSSNLQVDLLRHVEYGIYSSYFLTYEPTSEIINTDSWWIYTSSYEQWGDQVRDSYAWMNDLLAPVAGQEIIDHQQLASDVYMTTYANNRQIIVNYSEQSFTYENAVIAAQDAIVLESGQ